MTIKELKEKLEEFPEDMDVYFLPENGRAFKEAKNVRVDTIGWFHEIVAITN